MIKQLRFSISSFVLLLCVYVPSIVNAQESVLKKANLKVLDIGNSYTDDATAMLPLIVKASGSDVSDMCLYKAIRGSGSFKNWYDSYYDKDNSSYSISKVLGGIDVTITTGRGEGTDGSLFREALENEQWDIIIIHQYSLYAPYYDKWGTTGKGGYLKKFLSLIKKKQPQAVIGFLLVHSYWDDYRSNNEKSSFNRWQLIANSVKRVCEDYDIDFVIPYGTAVENLRSSSLNNEYDLTRDGSHCGIGLCRYTAACCYYESLIAPRSGISVIGNTARYNVTNVTSNFPGVSVIDENASIAQKAAVLATNNWYECINPEAVKCATPTISFIDGKLEFYCETEGVEFAYEIKDADIRKGVSNEVELSFVYTITFYAMKEGFDNSDVATATIRWCNGSLIFEGFSSVDSKVNEDGSVDEADIAMVISIMASRRL